MSLDKHQMIRDGDRLLARFSLPTDQLVKYAWNQFVFDNAKLHIRADLTYKQSRVLFCPPVGGRTITDKRTFITEDIAFANMEQFATRLNYAVYKNAFRRYNKKLNMICALEGGRGKLRENVRQMDIGKRFHAHLLIELPNFTYLRNGATRTKFDEDAFMQLIHREWISTEWGYNECKIERIKSTLRSSNYAIKYGLDSIDLNNTHIMNEHGA